MLQPVRNSLPSFAEPVFDINWHRYYPGSSGGGEKIDVPVKKLIENKWVTVSKCSLGTTPHTVQFCRSSHTVMLFDKGSFVEGEKRLGGLPVSSSGRIDEGVDVVPANMDFSGLAATGSNIQAILVSYHRNMLDAFGAQIDKYSNLQPALNLSSGLVIPLAQRIRDLCRSNLVDIDRMHLDAVVTLLFEEIVFAQKKDYFVINKVNCIGGLSSRSKRKVLDFLVENYSQKVDLDALSDLAGLSRFHFTRAFKTSFGIPPYKYLLNLRISKAAELLRNTEIPITQIALNVGFVGSSEFARAFRQEMNCSPREFRNLHQ